jgi:hypothetical protein
MNTRLPSGVRLLQCPLSRPPDGTLPYRRQGQLGGQLKRRIAVSPCGKCLHTWRWPWSSKPVHHTPRYNVISATIPACSLLNTTKSDALPAVRGGAVQVRFFLRFVRRRPGLSDAVGTSGATGGATREQLSRADGTPRGGRGRGASRSWTGTRRRRRPGGSGRGRRGRR